MVGVKIKYENFIYTGPEQIIIVLVHILDGELKINLQEKVL